MTPATLTSALPAHKPVTVPPCQPLPKAVLDPARPLLKLGLDVHLEFIMAVAQKDHASPQAPRKFTRAPLIEQVRKWVAQGFQVFCVEESCGFGFVLHRQLVEAGAQSFLITPIALNGQRKTDKLDARALCLRLSRWLDGNQDELAPIRIPSETEQRKREGTRRRQFLTRAIRCLANRGHGQVSEYCHLKLPHRWWGPRNWNKLSALDPWVLSVLEKLREVILALERQLAELERELKARVKDEVIPKGLGEISLVTLDGEVCDWDRFYNRKQIGSYTGCCPGEHSSGGKRRVGSIDRMGNGRVRTILVEAVWRFLKWQLAHGPLHAGGIGLGGGLSFFISHPETKNILIPIPQREVSWRFAIGRVQSGAAAGGPCVHPWVRRGGLPGRRSHTSTTPWALGFISTVRIGAGAWRKLANTSESGDTDQAGTHPHRASQGMQEQKGKRTEAFKKGNRGTDSGKKPGRPLVENLIAIARLRSTPLRSARSAFTKRKNLKT